MRPPPPPPPPAYMGGAYLQQQGAHGQQAQQQLPHYPQAQGYDPFAAQGLMGFQGQHAAFFGGGNPFMGNPWGMQQQSLGDGARQPVRFSALPLPQQTHDVDATCWAVANMWPELPGDRIPGAFAVAQTGEILTVRGPRDGEDWLRQNQRQDEQRWSVLNSTIAVLSASRNMADRTMLEQFQSLVQPTQFLEHIRRTLPMSETHLDMISTMHETMTQRLNALDVLYKGGQRAVDEYMSLTATGVDKKKSMAIAKGKKADPPSGGGGGGPRAKRSRRGGGNGAQNAPATSTGGGGQQQPFQKSGLKCGKCNKFGHRTEDCYTKMGT